MGRNEMLVVQWLKFVTLFKLYLVLSHVPTEVK